MSAFLTGTQYATRVLNSGGRPEAATDFTFMGCFKGVGGSDWRSMFALENVGGDYFNFQINSSGEFEAWWDWIDSSFLTGATKTDLVYHTVVARYDASASNLQFLYRTGGKGAWTTHVSISDIGGAGAAALTDLVIGAWDGIEPWVGFVTRLKAWSAFLSDSDLNLEDPYYEAQTNLGSLIDEWHFETDVVGQVNGLNMTAVGTIAWLGQEPQWVSHFGVPKIPAGCQKDTGNTGSTTHTVNLPTQADGVQDGDVLVAFAGSDQLGSAPTPPASPAYASGGWTVDAHSFRTTVAQVAILTCVVTDASSIPSTDTFTMAAIRSVEWWVAAVRGANYANRIISTRDAFGTLAWVGLTTLNDNALVIGGATGQSGTENVAGSTTTPGTWTLEHEDQAPGTNNGGITIGTLQQLTAGVVANQSLGTDSTSNASASIAFPPAATALISRFAVEALVQADPNARISRFAVEALIRDAVAGTTPVNASLALVWDLDGNVNNALALLWDIAGRVDSNAQLIWDDHTLASSPIDLVWDIRDLAQASASVVWDLDGFVNSDLDMIWDIAGLIQSDAQFIWDDHSTIPASLNLEWTIRELIQSDTSITWDLAGTLQSALDIVWGVGGVVGNNLDISWDIRESIAQQLNLLWDIDAHVSSPVTALWDISAHVDSTLQAIWDTLTVGQVTSQLGLIWDIEGQVQSLLSVLWDNRDLLSSALAIEWANRQLATAPMELDWSISGAIETTLALIWDIPGTVQSPIDLDWHIRETLQTTLAVEFAIRQVVGADIEFDWSDAGVTPSTLTLIWDAAAQIVGTAQSSTALSWEARALVDAALALVWSASGAVNSPLSLAWDVESLFTVDRIRARRSYSARDRIYAYRDREYSPQDRDYR